MGRRPGHSVLLGGVGADGHFVGLHILRRSLEGHGYRVGFLGIRNDIRDLIRAAPGYNAVLVSVMDGHAEIYLRSLLEEPLPRGPGHPVWYLGGNLIIDEAEGEEEAAVFRRMGFTRVFVKFVDLTTVLATLEADLAESVPVAARDRPPPHRRRAPLRPLSRGLLVDASFLEQRRRVLDGWRTGAAAAELAANAAHLAGRPSLPALLGEVAAGRRGIALQPRCGVGGEDEQLTLFRRFGAGGAAVVSYQVDSLTRANDYQGAERALLEAQRRGHSRLNGFPMVNHGVGALRRIGDQLELPVQTRHSTRDPRLLAEISYAGGVSGFEGGAICYNFPYYKDYPLRESIERWKYVDRLTGLYGERYGVVLDREFFGTLTATLLPPSIPIVTNILEALLAAAQGVKCVSLAYAEQGHRVQDVAAIRIQASLAREVLDAFGHRDVQVHTVFHQFMAAFPATRERAEELIYQSAVTSALAGASRLLTKTPSECRRIPPAEENLRGLALASAGVAEAPRFRQDAPPEAVERESALIRREAQAILEATLACGGGDLERGMVRAFATGILDIPFSPSVYNRGEVLTARDLEGAVRFLRPGRLPLPADVLDLHAELMEERRRASGLSQRRRDFELVEHDALQVARERYAAWPLAGCRMEAASVRAAAGR